MIKTLLFSTLFPNDEQPNHGVFVENRLRHLLRSRCVHTKVLAPVPWFPFKSRKFGKYAKFSRVKYRENRGGVDVLHPRYFLIPKYGMNSAPNAIYKSTLPYIEALIKGGFDFDLIDAHYFYPDGIAAVMLAEKLKKPVVITARGSDINLLARYEKPRSKIIWAANKANALVTVCQSLKTSLVSLGIDSQKINVLRNGVDLDKFSLPINRNTLRKELNLEGKVLLSVGNLIELKGHYLIINAMKKLPEFKLLIIGGGEDRLELEQLINSSGLNDRVTMVGTVDHFKLKGYYGAVDALVLASSREGWPNVLLEAMACGCPVLATNVGGVPEIVKSKHAGLLIQERSSIGIVDGVRKLFGNIPKREEVRAYSEQYSWDATTQGQIQLFSKILLDR